MTRELLKPLLLLAAAVCCARGGASAQEPCRLERSVAPDYGGVMLGMTAAELARMFPGSEELQRAPAAGAGDASKPFVASLGMLELGIRRDQFGDAGELALTFLAGRLQRIDVRYRRVAPWRDVAEFSAHASKRLAVPADAWGPAASDDAKQSRALDCRGFSVVVRVDRDGPSTLSIVDTMAADAPAPAAASPAPPPPPSKRRPRGRGRRP
ncbi:MAG TPA: hypothetical protein VF668_21470 [Pyrinomonadaceae bacterium]|jgi:hypothetical protein